MRPLPPEFSLGKPAAAPSANVVVDAHGASQVKVEPVRREEYQKYVASQPRQCS